MAVSKLSKGHNLRWESSRMMLPEHVEQFIQYQSDKGMVSKPILDEQKLEQISIVVMESLHYTIDVKLTYWKDGFFEELIGVVSKVDVQLKQIKIETANDYFYVFINHITAVERQ